MQTEQIVQSRTKKQLIVHTFKLFINLLVGMLHHEEEEEANNFNVHPFDMTEAPVDINEFEKGKITLKLYLHFLLTVAEYCVCVCVWSFRLLTFWLWKYKQVSHLIKDGLASYFSLVDVSCGSV
jgi:hypothetical protein